MWRCTKAGFLRFRQRDACYNFWLMRIGVTLSGTQPRESFSRHGGTWGISAPPCRTDEMLPTTNLSVTQYPRPDTRTGSCSSVCRTCSDEATTGKRRFKILQKCAARARPYCLRLIHTIWDHWHDHWAPTGIHDPYLSEVGDPVISANRLGTAVYAFAGTRVYTSYTNY